VVTASTLDGIPALHRHAGRGSAQVYEVLRDLLERADTDVTKPDPRRVLVVTVREWIRWVNERHDDLDDLQRNGTDTVAAFRRQLPPPSMFRGMTDAQLHNARRELDRCRWLILARGQGDDALWRPGRERRDCIPIIAPSSRRTPRRSHR
jgi:hypothetical protein